MTQSSHSMNQYLYQKLIQPRAADQDAQRREFILNVLICGLTLVAVLAAISSLITELAGDGSHYQNSEFITVGFLLFTVGLWWLSRRGGYRVATFIILGLVGLVALNLIFVWSFELPEAELSYALVIMLSTVLLKPRSALIIAGAAAGSVLVLAYLQVYHMLRPHTDWLNQKLEMSDAIGYVAIFIIIALVSWLANREIDRSLFRARTSESALEKERDNLEDKVVKRTAELERVQLARVLELQRFAEFGRLSAGLLHEVANPLTAASLNVAQLEEADHPDLVVQIKKNLGQLGRYLEAARKQLQGQDHQISFSVRSELTQVQQLLLPQAAAAGIKLRFQQAEKVRLYGNPVKFSQLIANLVANGIEAYDGLKRQSQRLVTVAVSRQQGTVVITVHDWGRGIAPANIPNVFKPFFSTKLTVNRGLGIGLAMVKQFVEEDFQGTISVTSSRRQGTMFTVSLRDSRRSL